MRAGGLRDVTLRMPVAVPTGSTASLLCLYDLEGDQLYTVKWYKGRQEFFRYVLKELPHTRVFALPGINVDIDRQALTSQGRYHNWGATAKHVICPYVAPLGFGVVVIIQNRCKKVSETDKKKKISKLEKIRPKKCDLPKDGKVNTDANNKNVINLSSKILNEAEISVLSKGLNFSVVQKSVKALELEQSSLQNDTTEIVACISSQVGCTSLHEVVASGAEMVVLRDVQKFLSGKYRCEVSSDAPHFHTEVVSGYMHVVNELLEEPVIRLEKNSYSAGDTLRANCSSPPSSPPANVTWYLNGEEEISPNIKVFKASHLIGKAYYSLDETITTLFEISVKHHLAERHNSAQNVANVSIDTCYGRLGVLQVCESSGSACRLCLVVYLALVGIDSCECCQSNRTARLALWDF
ncbi:hypothetical protein J6590_102460 [Homalodisca vitripennis]|nr:hypothetical protein J6590_102460 [Homalodisca vitripennis]